MDFPCTPCNRRFKTDEALKQHENFSPMHTKAFHCDPCNRSFTCKKTLAKHKRECQVVQKLAPDTVKISSDQASKMAELSNALARVSILNMPALAVQRHARMPVLENPVTAKPPMVVTRFPRPPKKDPPKRPRETRKYFTFPELHTKIEQAVLPEITSTWFNACKDDYTFNNNEIANFVGSFKCNNENCDPGVWSSGLVATHIRGYRGNGYTAIVYNQRCRSCNWLGTFELNEESYIDRVSYRIKKWAGVVPGREYLGSGPKGPHAEGLCEGCSIGRCPWVIGRRSISTASSS